MSRSRLAEATLIGCLAALASFCALNARAEETYSIVAQSTRSSAATGCRPLSERIAAANLPLITQSTATAAAVPRETTPEKAPTPVKVAPETENMAVAAVRVDHETDASAVPPPPSGFWQSLGFKWPTSTATVPTAPAKQSIQKQTQASGRSGQRQTTARASGKGLSNSSPATVTR